MCVDFLNLNYNTSTLKSVMNKTKKVRQARHLAGVSDTKYTDNYHHITSEQMISYYNECILAVMIYRDKHAGDKYRLAASEKRLADLDRKLIDLML